MCAHSYVRETCRRNNKKKLQEMSEGKCASADLLKLRASP